MNVYEFVVHETERLDAFVKYWRHQHAIDPQSFPVDADMNENEWLEQLDMFDLKLGE